MGENSYRCERSAELRLHLLRIMMRAAVLAAVLIISDHYLFWAFTVPGNDMFPQIRAGDLAVCFIPGSPERHDAVIYISTAGMRAGRIEGLPGDTIDRTGSGLLEINGVIQTTKEREGIYSETEAEAGSIQYPVTLKDEEYFILGDSRKSAVDSRATGIVKRSEIRGVVFILIRRQAV